MDTRILCLLLLMSSITISTGQHRWVWGSRRSGRQLDLGRPISPVLPHVGAAVPSPPAGVGSAAPSFPPSAPFGLIPSASSLFSQGSITPINGQSSSFSISEAQNQASLGSSNRNPTVLEPLVFKPLPIDISKLPLESSSNGDSLEGEFHPPFAPIPSLRDSIVNQDLASGSSFQRPGHPDQFPGITSSFQGQGEDLPGRGRDDFINTEAFSTVDISRLPLEGRPVSSLSDGHGRLEVNPSPFAGRPTLGSFDGQASATPSNGGSVHFPQRISSIQAINIRPTETENTRAFKQPRIIPNPTRIFIENQKPQLDKFPFLKSKQQSDKEKLNEFLDKANIATRRGTIRFPKDIKKINSNSDQLELFDSIASGTIAEISSYAFLPPQSGAVPQGQAEEFLRPDRSITSNFKSLSPKQPSQLGLSFKNLRNQNSGVGIPPYAWLWPNQVQARAVAARSFSSPSNHAL